jgi:hypothetical protein
MKAFRFRLTSTSQNLNLIFLSSLMITCNASQINYLEPVIFRTLLPL